MFYVYMIAENSNHSFTIPREDWDSEGQMMADYYANAYLTIAASRASNSSAGFLHLTDRRRLSTIHGESDGIKFDCIVLEPGSRRLETRGPNFEAGNPLYTRAWVFQEMVLSPRVISFGAKELEWYCRQRNWCECSYLMPRDLRVMHSPHWQDSREGLFRSNYQEWMKIVREFTRRRLTFTSDKLPALSGLAARFKQTINAPYLAGIWKTDPFEWEALKWTTSGGFPGDLLPKPGPPSWSWASINCRISYDDMISGVDGVTLLAAETQLRGLNPYGEVTGGFLRVRGALLKVQLDIMPAAQASTWRKEPSYNWMVLSTGGGVMKELEDIIEENSNMKKIRFYPDTPLELAPSSELSCVPTEKNYQRSLRSKESAVEPMNGVVYCLRFLRRPVVGILETTSVWLLVLGCTDKRTQSYERIGLAYLEMVKGNRQFFLEMESQELILV